MKNSIFRLPPKYFISYEYGGSDFTGCDCYGFVQLFYREELGINLIDFPRVGTNRTNLPEDYVRNRQSFEFDKVEFPVKSMHEDLYINLQVMLYAKSVFHLKRNFYHYRNNPNSITHNYPLEQSIENLSLMRCFLEKKK